MQNYYFKTLKKYSNILGFCFLATILVQCKSIIAEDISSEQISTILPTQDNVITSNSVNFKWTDVGFADQYQIQIVTPTFTSPTAYIIDSLVVSTDIDFTLTPNDYQWRVKALNNISETTYTEAVDFTVDEVIELTNQIVVLNTPINNVYLNSIQLNFTWDYLSAADSYLFQLVKGDEFSNDIIEQVTTTNNFYLPTTQTLEDDHYTWKVRATNSFSETAFAFKKFSIDSTVPNTPVLLNPLDGDTSTLNTNFDWNTGVDLGNIQSPTTSILEISTTSDFNTLFDEVEITQTEYDYTFATTGLYYWRVYSFDEAGNVGEYSETREITIE